MQMYSCFRRESVFAQINFGQYAFFTTINKPYYIINGTNNRYYKGKNNRTIVPYLVTLQIGKIEEHRVFIFSVLKKIIAHYINKELTKKNKLQNRFNDCGKVEDCSNFTKHQKRTPGEPLYFFPTVSLNFRSFKKYASKTKLEDCLSVIKNVSNNQTKIWDQFFKVFFFFFNNHDIWQIPPCKAKHAFSSGEWSFFPNKLFPKYNCVTKFTQNEINEGGKKGNGKEKEKGKDEKGKDEKEKDEEFLTSTEKWKGKNASQIKDEQINESVDNKQNHEDNIAEKNKEELKKNPFSKEQKQKNKEKETASNESNKLDKSDESKKSDEPNWKRETITEEEMKKIEHEKYMELNELNRFYEYMQKLSESKNNKVNINIKILVYIFNNFISKNKELKARMFYSFVFLLCSKISVICTPIFLSSFIENVNLEKNISEKMNITNQENIMNEKMSTSFFFLSSYVFSRILSSGLTELRNAVFNSVSQRIATYVSKLFFYKIHCLNLSYILSKKNGELSFIFNRGCKSITNLLNVTVFQIIPIILEFFLYLFILTYKIHFNVSLVTCFNMFLYVLFTTMVTKRRTLIRKNMNKAEQNTSNIFLDSIQNIEQVKYHTNEIHELKKFLVEQKKYEKEAINVQQSLSFLNYGQQLILNFNLFVCLYLTYINILNGVFPFSYLILVNTLLFQLAIPLNMFGTIYRETRLSLVDVESMINILRKKTKNEGNQKNITTIQNGSISFDNVCFRYPIIKKQKNEQTKPNEAVTENKTVHFYKRFKNIFSFSKKKEEKSPSDEKHEVVMENTKDYIKEGIKSETKKDQQQMILSSTIAQMEKKKEQIFSNVKEFQYLFENFNCRVENGELVGIVGKSGAGKSTLVKLLLKFYDINTGNIYIDNINIDDISVYALRKNICVVPQDTILFNNTIAYNIKYGNLHCSNKEMINASIQSELHDKILKMENQYDTIVGERGTKLSKGETQRVCIARCFLKNAKIIILDEHVSNLDNENKQSIDRALQNLCSGKTTIIITHLMENLGKFNKILFFHDKNIDVGTHDQLMTNNIHYQHFYNSRNNNLNTPIH